MIGSWWEQKKVQHEIDIVTLKLDKNHALAIEVKRNKKNFKPNVFKEKVQHLKQKALPKYHIETLCWSSQDL
ncbi:MAG: DUF234 domain-containing protein [Prolixibacteraceae bacterium]|nr:DUF234 domain-containing protein [Prolixibacteraceae bacterium]